MALWVIYTAVLQSGAESLVNLCCYTPSYDMAEGALEEYAIQWLSGATGIQRGDEALEDERPLETVGCGLHLRFSDCDNDGGNLYPIIRVYQVRERGDYSLVRIFGLLPVNQWKEDFLNEVTPAVEALATDDTVAGAIYSANRPEGRVARRQRQLEGTTTTSQSSG